jgi:hypothetical protein
MSFALQLKALLLFLPMIWGWIPGVGKSPVLLRFLPTLAPLIDEVDDLVESGGLTQQNMEEAVQRAFAAFVALYPTAAVVDQADITELAGVNFRCISKIVNDLHKPPLVLRP